MVLRRNLAEFNLCVIEDDATTRVNILRRLRKSGFNLEISNFFNCLSEMEPDHSYGFDAILLDMFLPNSSGIESFIKCRNKFKNTPIVILSSMSDLDFAREAVALGAQDFINKDNLGNADLQRIISYAVERQSLLNEIIRQSQYRSEFLANMSHEIRTPLNAIIGLTEIISLEENLTKQQSNYLELLKASGEHLHNLVSDILDVSKLDSGHMKVNLEVFNLHKSLFEMCSIYSKTVTKQVRFNVEVDPRLNQIINGDRIKLSQILSNLVGNAVKFTSTGSIMIAAFLQESTEFEIKCCIQITDTGCGISENDLKNLFSPYIQGSKNASNVKGTGLGLYICQRLISLMCGNIHIQSTPGRGSIVTIELPFEKCSTNHGIEPSKLKNRNLHTEGIVDRAENKILALVVDDDTVNQLVLTKMLNEIGISTNVASDGIQAIEISKEIKFDYLFMDCRMPLLDGIQASKILRSQPGLNQNTPIIAVTANAFEQDKNDCLDAGMTGFLSKPIKMETIRQCIKTLSDMKNIETIDSDASQKSFEFNDSLLEIETLKRLFELDKDKASQGDFLHLIIEEFHKSFLSSFKVLADTTTTEPITSRNKHAHKLKGLCKNVGASSLAKLFSSIEESTSIPDSDSLKSELNEILNLYNRTKEELDLAFAKLVKQSESRIQASIQCSTK